MHGQQNIKKMNEFVLLGRMFMYCFGECVLVVLS